jgi:hypothetical protein
MESFIFGPSYKQDLQLGFGQDTVILADGSSAALDKIGIHSLLGQEIFNAVDFGADISGTSDSTTAIQAAINQISTAGTLILPAGTYKCLTGLTTNGRPLKIIGSGPGATILSFPNLGVIGLNIADALTHVSDLTIRGPNASSIGYSGINSGSVSDVTLENLVVENWGEAGINTGGFAARWIIRGCRIRNNKEDGIFLGIGSTDCIVEANEVYGNGSNGIDVNGSRNLINANQVRSNGARHAGSTDCWGILIAAVPGADANDNTVSNNIVSANFGQGIIVKPTTSQATNYNLIVNNQSIANTGSGGNGDGITLDGSDVGTLLGNLVANNICIGNQRYGVLGDGSVATFSQNQFRNNTCTGNVHGLVVTAGALDTQVSFNLVLSNSSDQITDGGTRTSQFGNKVQTSDGGIYTGTRLGLNLVSGAYGILDVRSGATGAEGIFLGETTNGWLLTEKGDASFALRVTASGVPSGADRLNLTNGGLLSVINGIQAAGNTPTPLSGYVGIGTTEGVGAGSAGTPVTTTTKGGGSGPATAQVVVKYLELSLNGATYWLPLFQ